MDSYISPFQRETPRYELFHDAGELLAERLHAVAVDACKSLGLVELDQLDTKAGIADAVDLPIEMLIDDRGRRPNASQATAFTVIPGSSDIEDPNPQIILGIQAWEAKGYKLAEDAKQMIDGAREFMAKLFAAIQDED